MDRPRHPGAAPSARREPSPAPPDLDRLLRRATEGALRQGALQPIPTTHETVMDGGVPFQLRVVDSLRRKAAEGRRRREDHGGQGGDPFDPYDRALFVAPLPPDHVALLNKFNVLDRHLLVVTREFVDQRVLLDERDMAALWACMVQVDGLGFYNGGVEAGASQPHKHLQLVPFPLSPGRPRPPIEEVLLPAVIGGDAADPAPRLVPALPFVHAAVRVDDLGDEATAAAGELARRYRRLLAAVGLPAPHRADRPALQPGPYNWLLTRRWMLVVPRSREHVGSVSVNAIGFAGGLLVRDAGELALVREVGPMTVLRRVGIARHRPETGGPDAP